MKVKEKGGERGEKEEERICVRVGDGVKRKNWEKFQTVNTIERTKDKFSKEKKKKEIRKKAT